MTHKCISHCASCGSHFRSDRSFDAHRVGPPEDRRCEEPEDALNKHGARVFIALTEDGVCDIDWQPPKTGVTLWTLRRDYERAQRQWGERASRPSEAESVPQVPPTPVSA